MMTKIYEHDLPAPLSRRRFSVSLAYGCWVASLLAFFLLLLTGNSFWKASQEILSMLSLLGVFLTQAAAAGLPKLQDHRLDERERTRLTDAYAKAHRLTVLALGTGFLVVTLLSLFDVKVFWPRVYVWSVLLTISFLCLWVLPTAVLAWSEPDYQD